MPQVLCCFCISRWPLCKYKKIDDKRKVALQYPNICRVFPTYRYGLLQGPFKNTCSFFFNSVV